MLSKEMFLLYKEHYLKAGGKNAEQLGSYTPQALQRKIVEAFPETILYSLYDTVKGNMFYSKSLSHTEAAKIIRGECDEMGSVRDLALKLRQQILSSVTRTRLSEGSVESIKSHWHLITSPMFSFMVKLIQTKAI